MSNTLSISSSRRAYTLQTRELYPLPYQWFREGIRYIISRSEYKATAGVMAFGAKTPQPGG